MRFSRKLEIFFLVALIVVGVVLINKLPISKNSDIQVNKCSRVENKANCWKDLVTATFEKKGLVEAYDLVANLYETDPEFAPVCHDFGHLLGKDTYELFAQGRDFKITPKTAYCSYGFYHGFMEALVSSEGNPKKAREFCLDVDEQLARETPDATLQCFHGIGHGWANVHSNPELWGKEEEIARRGVELCVKVAGNDSELSRCATGVFNGIATFYGTGEYGLKLNRQDPLWLCKKQPGQFKDPCYVSLNVALVAAGDGDLVRAARFVEAIPEDEYAQHAMLNLAIPFGVKNFNSPDHSKAIADCRRLQPRLRIPCLQGYAFAFLESGKPGEEYLRPLDFCSLPDLTSQESRECQGYIFAYLAQWYPEEKAMEICNGRPESEKDYCTTTLTRALNEK